MHFSRPFAILPLFPLLPFFLLMERIIATADIVEFLFQNQRICGEPFADAQWVPVLDLCELECKMDEEICMEDDQMKQSCRKLPPECILAFRVQKAANLRKGVVQMDNQKKATIERPKQLTMTTKKLSSTPRPTIVVGKNNAAVISAFLSVNDGEEEPTIITNPLMRRSARRKKQSRKLRANAGGKTRQIVVMPFKGKRRGQPSGTKGSGRERKGIERRKRRNEKRATAAPKVGEMRLRQRKWRGKKHVGH